MISPRWTVAIGTCACAAAGACVFTTDPAAGGLYPRCVFHEVTGYYCAGCGATRALYALLHGRVLDALHDNVLFVLLLPVALTLVWRTMAPAWRDNRWPSAPINATTFLLRTGLLAGAAAVFMALRNIPGAPFDWLRPLA